MITEKPGRKRESEIQADEQPGIPRQLFQKMIGDLAPVPAVLESEELPVPSLRQPDLSASAALRARPVYRQCARCVFQ